MQNTSDLKGKYNKEVQDRYKAKCMQIAIRYGLNESDVIVSQAIENYCKDNNISRGALARMSIVEKLKREGYI